MADIPLATAFSSSLTWRILDLLMNEDMQELEIAKSLGVPLKIAKNELERIEDAGLAVSRSDNLPSGKVKLYSLTRNSRSLGYPPRGYQNLSESIISKLVESMGQEGARMILKDIGVGIGEDIGRDLLSRADSTRWNPKIYADLFCQAFPHRNGNVPEVEEHRENRFGVRAVKLPFSGACRQDARTSLRYP